jgi:hypothetical protein
MAITPYAQLNSKPTEVELKSFYTRGIGVAPNQNLAKNTVMGRITSSGLWCAYNSANSDGSQVPRGILVEAYNNNSAFAPLPFEAPAVYQFAMLYCNGLSSPNLPGLDANALSVTGWTYDAALSVLYVFPNAVGQSLSALGAGTLTTSLNLGAEVPIIGAKQALVAGATINLLDLTACIGGAVLITDDTKGVTWVYLAAGGQTVGTLTATVAPTAGTVSATGSPSTSNYGITEGTVGGHATLQMVAGATAATLHVSAFPFLNHA